MEKRSKGAGGKKRKFDSLLGNSNEEKAKNKSGVDTTQAQQTRTPSTHVSTTAANFNNAGFSGVSFSTKNIIHSDWTFLTFICRGDNNVRLNSQ